MVLLVLMVFISRKKAINFTHRPLIFLDSDLEPGQKLLQVVKDDDWFKCRRFSRIDAVMLASICSKDIISHASLSTGYISKNDYEFCLLNAKHELAYRLTKYDWTTVIKDKLKNMVITLRKKKDFESFQKFIDEAEPFKCSEL